jgi:ubiquinone/menaquinone biosynthesis C-methylase UbiE
MVKPDPLAQARHRFDGELHTDEYRRVHSDAAHLEALMDMLNAIPRKRYLDLGTGNGYLAFEMARRFPDIAVTGLDIARDSIRLNQKIQTEQGIENIEFLSYDGSQLPFGEACFAGVISRYAFHHFPDPHLSVHELSRITEDLGVAIVSDPMTYEEDTADFIDQFQRLKGDGHVHFFRSSELDALFHGHGFAKEAQFLSSFSFPRALTDAYLRLLEKTPGPVLERYGIELREQTIQATLTVMNAKYRKSGKSN